MLILEILVGVLLFGVCSFMAMQFYRQQMGITKPLAFASLDGRRQRAQIENKLDQLLMLHEQGRIPEKQYLFLVDQLIDQLATLRDTAASSAGMQTR